MKYKHPVHNSIMGGAATNEKGDTHEKMDCNHAGVDNGIEFGSL